MEITYTRAVFGTYSVKTFFYILFSSRRNQSTPKALLKIHRISFTMLVYILYYIGDFTMFFQNQKNKKFWRTLKAYILKSR